MSMIGGWHCPGFQWCLEVMIRIAVAQGVKKAPPYSPGLLVWFVLVHLMSHVSRHHIIESSPVDGVIDTSSQWICYA